jgi:hypothetical protein
LTDRYALLERTATLPTGESWRGVDAVRDRPVTVILLDPAHADTQLSKVARLVDLAHPGLPAVYETGTSDGRSFVVCEHVTGEPVASLTLSGAPLATTAALDLVGQAALALHAAHRRGVAHGALSARWLLRRDDGSVTVAGWMLGPADASPSDDLRALADVLLTCLGAEAPQPVPTPPPAVRELLTAMRRADADAGDVGRSALALAMGDPPPPAPPESSPVAHRDELPADTDTARPGQAEAELDRERLRTRNRLIGVGAVVVVLGFLALKACGGGAATAAVPSVTGSTAAAATGRLHAAGLLVAQRRMPSADVPAGTVVGESPSAGRQARAGSTVVLTVSSGPAAVTVDAAGLLGLPRGSVVARLRGEGLTVRVVRSASTRPAGTVTAVTPSGELRAGSTVTVTVAGGAGRSHG